MAENDQNEKPKSNDTYKIWIESVDPITGEAKLTDTPKIGKVYTYTTDRQMIEVQPEDLPKLLALLKTMGNAPYKLSWRNLWQRGVTKAVKISPIPEGNPRHN